MLETLEPEPEPEIIQMQCWYCGKINRRPVPAPEGFYDCPNCGHVTFQAPAPKTVKKGVEALAP